MRPDTDGTISTHHYCPECKAIQPTVRDQSLGHDVKRQYFGGDIVCSQCHYVISTEYWELTQ